MTPKGQPPTDFWPVPRAAYVHVPFCRHRCGYCNFSVLAGRDDDYADAYLEALARELEQLGSPRPVDSLFIGGGTPTHLSPPWIARLLRLVADWFPLTERGEFSVEANPSDLDRSRLQVLSSAGVNRLSMGVQSFDSATLQTLERDHRGAEAVEAIQAAVESVGNVSIDLIFGVPGQSTDSFQRDLDQAIALPIQHLSTYGLTFEKGTRFWARRQHGQLAAVAEDEELEMYQQAIRYLTEHGMEHYEVSNFARPGSACRHNLAYWEGRGWFAAGPGAARFVRGRREVNHRSPTTYIRKLLAAEDATAESESIDRVTWARERLVFGLRMRAGVDLEQIRQETGVDLQTLCDADLQPMQEIGLIERVGTRVQLTERGLFVSDSVLERLI